MAQILNAEEKKLIFIEAEYNGSISWPVWMVPVVRGLTGENGPHEAVIRAHAALRATVLSAELIKSISSVVGNSPHSDQ